MSRFRAMRISSSTSATAIARWVLVAAALSGGLACGGAGEGSETQGATTEAVRHSGGRLGSFHWPRVLSLYAGPQGRERASGTFSDPLSLGGARELARRLRGLTRLSINIYLRGGTYRLRKTLVLGREDGGRGEQVIRYLASPGERPTLTSGYPITGWRKPTSDETPSGLPAAARNQVWQADVSEIRRIKRTRGGAGSDWRFRTLYRDGESLPRARGPQIVPPPTSPAHGRRDLFYFPAGALRRYPALRDAELVVIPRERYVMNILPIAAVDENRGVATLAAPASYALERHGNTRGWVENVVELLDRPGEWVLDSQRAKLYYWPSDGERPSKVEAPLLTELVRIEGAVDVAGPKDRPVRNIELRGITFTGGDRLPWSGRTGLGLQHDWELFDRPTALVRLRGAEDCTVADNRFVQSGHTGLRLDLHARRNRIAGNTFSALGGVAILLAGYGPGTKDVNSHNTVRNNYIHDIGRHYWGSPGIFVWQSGDNVIAHNQLHDLPYSGIVVSGRVIWDRHGVAECSGTIRWREVEAVTGNAPRPTPSWNEQEPYLHARNNLVERNDVSDVVKVCGDGNCIYVSGAGKGNVVRQNHCHDSFGPGLNAGLRCDDLQHEVELAGNIVQRHHGRGEGIISKGRNDIVNNFLVDLRPTEPARHRGYVVLLRARPSGARIQRNVFFSQRAGQLLYGQGIPYESTGLVYLADADADYNLYFNNAEPSWATDHLRRERAKGIEQQSQQEDPQFTDVLAGGLDFRPGSPAPAMGIEAATPLSQIGLQSHYRARLIGPQIATKISPASGRARFPLDVTLSADYRQAAIHYTTDGSEPTRDSPRYDGELTLIGPTMIRAKSFAEGRVDLVGASEGYALPAGWIAEGFEHTRPGQVADGATTVSESADYSALVTADHAASGKRSLRFVDGPGQTHASKPYVVYRPRLAEGRLRLRFSLRPEANTRFHIEWRDHRSRAPAFVQGPTVRFEGGKVAFGSERVAVPSETWIHVTLESTLGPDASAFASASLSWPGGGHHFSPVRHDDAFARLDWLGFISYNKTRRSACYLDDIVLDRVNAD